MHSSGLEQQIYILSSFVFFWISLFFFLFKTCKENGNPECRIAAFIVSAAIMLPMPFFPNFFEFLVVIFPLFLGMGLFLLLVVQGLKNFNVYTRGSLRFVVGLLLSSWLMMQGSSVVCASDDVYEELERMESCGNYSFEDEFYTLEYIREEIRYRGW